MNAQQVFNGMFMALINKDYFMFSSNLKLNTGKTAEYKNKIW